MFLKNIIACVLAALVLVSCKSSVFDLHKVPTASMEPNIEAGGAVFVNKLAYGLRVPFTEKYLVRWADPFPADVVILSSPLGELNNWVKRVVGVQGYHIAVEDGLLYVNGYELECMSLAKDGLSDGLCLETLGVFTYLIDWGLEGAKGYPFTDLDVPKDHVFVLGDNRNHTYVAEPVSVGNVLGKVHHVVGSDVSLYVTVIYNVTVFIMFFFILSCVNRLLVKSDDIK